MIREKTLICICEEPWLGNFFIRINGDVIFCPCNLFIKIGNINKNSLLDIWNGGKIRCFRKQFNQGHIPSKCLRANCGYVVNTSKKRR
jgi:MoaA/NifB/PqqE/SkfB family radical SAM enzyme